MFEQRVQFRAYRRATHASLSQVSAILLVLGADIFKKIAVRYKRQCSSDGKGAGVILRVIEGVGGEFVNYAAIGGSYSPRRCFRQP